MHAIHTRRAGLILALLPAFLLLGNAALLSADKAPDAKLTTLQGKVVPLAELVKKAGGKLDADAAPHWLALVAEDKVYPLVKDDGGRAFFKDKTLLGREMRLTGRLVPGSQMLRVLSFKSIVKGVPHEVYYWCDICSIQRGELNICECCGGPMELRESPVKK